MNFTEVLLHQHKKSLHKIRILIIEELRNRLLCVRLHSGVCIKLTEAERGSLNPQSLTAVLLY